MRCTVESVLKSTLVEGSDILPRERWIATLQLTGCSEQNAQALLKDQKSNLSVDEFLNIIFGPKADSAPQVTEGMITVTDNLPEYFETCYREGGRFEHPDYEDTLDAAVHTWLHLPTGIQVWQDAIDLTSGQGGCVFFHFTSELAFRNITAPAKKAAEVWASLNSDPGPKQNAWWGKGVYSVPLPPDQWRDCNQLLDNNFRNMMARDQAAVDKGPEFVREEYPKRVAFCVPIIIDIADAYDVSVRATPEMEAAGKPPGRNLGDKLLNEPGMPQRCCVVLRVSGEDGVKHAQGQLLNVLRRRAAMGGPHAKYRLGEVLRHRGLYDEALPVMREVLHIYEAMYGPESWEAVASVGNLANLLCQMGRYSEALELQRRNLGSCEVLVGPQDRNTLGAMSNLAFTLDQLGKYAESLKLHRKALEIRYQTQGVEDPETLVSMENVGLALYYTGNGSEAAEMQRKAVEGRKRSLGEFHPDTLSSMTNLGLILNSMGKYNEAAELQQKALEIMQSTLGEQHPFTLASMSDLGFTFNKMGKCAEAADLLRKALQIQEKTLGAEHLDTLHSMTTLGSVLTNLGNCAEADALLRTAVAMECQTLGAEHPDTSGTLSELAVTLRLLGDLNEAVELQRRALGGMETALGPEHPDTKLSRQRLEEVLQDLGR